MIWRCHQCANQWDEDKRVPGAKELCPTCAAYLHCCLNCKHRDPRAHNQCRIPNTDWVGDRKGPNFCDEFEFAAPAATTGTGSQQRAKDAFSGLFGDAPAHEPPAGFDDLFKS